MSEEYDYVTIGKVTYITTKGDCRSSWRQSMEELKPRDKSMIYCLICKFLCFFIHHRWIEVPIHKDSGTLLRVVRGTERLCTICGKTQKHLI